MDKISAFFEDLGIHLALIIAGVFGSLLSLEDKEGLSTWQKIIVFLSGGAIANYLAPILIEYTGMNNSVSFGFAFILGFLGLKGLKLIILIIKKRWGGNSKDKG